MISEIFIYRFHFKDPEISARHPQIVLKPACIAQLVQV